MEPALFAEFCQEFTKEMNRLRMDATASLAGKRAELAKIERQLQKLLEALLDDGDSKTIVKNMQALEARQEALEAELSQADSPPPLLHPNMAEVYHRQIRELHAVALTSDEQQDRGGGDPSDANRRHHPDAGRWRACRSTSRAISPAF